MQVRGIWLYTNSRTLGCSSKRSRMSSCRARKEDELQEGHASDSFEWHLNSPFKRFFSLLNPSLRGSAGIFDL